jgi:hypothetical protein
MGPGSHRGSAGAGEGAAHPKMRWRPPQSFGGATENGGPLPCPPLCPPEQDRKDLSTVSAFAFPFVRTVGTGTSKDLGAAGFLGRREQCLDGGIQHDLMRFPCV